MQRLLFEDGQGEKPPEKPVVLSYGLGVDSTAILLRWIRDRRSRNFPLDSLIVLTAQTGDEFQQTGEHVERHILPLLREFRIRYVQVARAGPLEADGIVVLDDTRQPEKVHLAGARKLSDELLSVGTVPQVASGRRQCTAKYKGFPLDTWVDRELAGRQVKHAIGYNADEQKRAEKGEGYSTAHRQFEFPLLEWGWGRDHCERYIRRITGETWRKSCCTFCPFASGKPDILDRYRQFPAEAANALFLEHVSMALNENMTLYSGKSLRSVIEADGNTEALRLLEEKLDAVSWAVYRVRRVIYAKGRADRKTERLFEGKRAEAASELSKIGGSALTEGLRVYVRRRAETYPTLEEMLVAAPAVVQDKCRESFDAAWERLSGKTLWDDQS